jgi:hypothetical protein
VCQSNRKLHFDNHQSTVLIVAEPKMKRIFIRQMIQILVTVDEPVDHFIDVDLSIRWKLK